MLLSGGVLTKSPTTLWEGSPSAWPGWDRISLTGNRWASYSSIYRQQLWVYTVVSKLAKGTARLPLKVYERDDLNRPEVLRDHPYAQLLRRPNERHSPFFFWLWVSSTFDVFGECFLGKLRDSGGRPAQLVPLHPVSMTITGERDGRSLWKFENGNVRIENIDSADLVHLKTYNPDDERRGMSPLEPLRRTLEFEDAAQRAQSSFWSKGARPGVALSHPKNISEGAAKRLKVQWDQIASGADNTGTTVVLEEGMKPEVLTISANEAQYIESRKLNREEVCGAYDVPPPVVHILDRATFSNITEQMRSMYRDTMAPRLKWFESELEQQLRGAVRPGASEPDFGGDVYAEFLLDEVLRGDFEVRANAYSTAINAGWMQPAEVRRAENLPYVEGSDRLFYNSTLVPVATEVEDKFDKSDGDRVAALGALVRAGFEPGPSAAAVGLPEIPHTGLIPVTVQTEEMPAAAIRSVMGRIGWQKSLADINEDQLVAGLNGHTDLVLAALTAAKAEDITVTEFRDRLRAVLGG